jgi:hypothetical protein
VTKQEPVITFPPEMLPKPDEDDIVEVWVENDDGSRALIYSNEHVGPVVVCTVGELIEALEKFPPEYGVIALEPPFTGVKLVPQASGKILFSAPSSRPKPPPPGRRRN